MSDLNALFVSRVRLKILQLFLSNPGELYYIREIVRLIDEEINAVRRELDRQQQHGILRSEWRGNRKYYEFRTDFLYHRDLLGIVVKSTGLGRNILEEKSKLGKIKYAFVTLAYALGEEIKEGEVALMVVGDIVLPELTYLVHEEEKRTQREIHYTVMTGEEFEFRKDHNDPFLHGLIREPKIMIIGNELDMVE